MDIQQILQQAFETANLVPTEYDIQTTAGEKTNHDTIVYTLTIQYLCLPNRKLIIDFEVQEDNYVLDINVSHNTLLEGRDFKNFFWNFTKPESIVFS